MFCSAGLLGTPQNMMLVNMVQRSREKQQERRCTRVKLLFAGRFKTEYQMWPSHKSFAVLVKKILLEVGVGKEEILEWGDISLANVKVNPEAILGTLNTSLKKQFRLINQLVFV